MPLDLDLDIPTFLQRADAVAPKAKPVPMPEGKPVFSKAVQDYWADSAGQSVKDKADAALSPAAQKISDESRELATPAMVSALHMPNEEPVAAATGAGMIFLRRSGEHKHWVVQFTGLKQVQCDAVLDVPLPCNATLRDVLAWLGTTYNGKLGGAWLLVAP